MFFLDLTLKSCILWIFSLSFSSSSSVSSLLHFHCEFIRVCSLVELFLLALCTHHTPNIQQQQQQHPKPELWEKSQILSNSQKISVLKLLCSCSTFYAYFFCSFFRHYHEPLEIRNLFIFHPNEQFWDFFLCFSHTRSPPLCVDYAWNFPIFISKSTARWRVEASRAVERKKNPFCRYSLNVSCRSCVSTFTTLLFSIWSAEGGREVEWHDLITIFLICRSADHHRSSSGSQVNETTSDEVNLSSPETSIFCCSHPPPSPFGDPVSSSCRWNVKSYRHDESSHDWHR